MTDVIGSRSIVGACVALLPGIVFSQSSAAGSPHRIRITGRVVDPTNMALPGGTVSLTLSGSDAVKSRILANEYGVLPSILFRREPTYYDSMRQDSFLAECYWTRRQ